VLAKTASTNKATSRQHKDTLKNNLTSEDTIVFRSSQGEELPEGTVYERFFKMVNNFDQEADKQEKLGFPQKAYVRRTHFQRKAQLSDRQYQELKELANNFQREVNLLKAQKGKIVSFLKEQPNETKFVTQLSESYYQRSQLWSKYRDLLREMFSSNGFEQLRNFLQENIAGKIKRGLIATKRHPHPMELNSSNSLDVTTSYFYNYSYSEINYDEGLDPVYGSSATWVEGSGGGPYFFPEFSGEGGACDPEEYYCWNVSIEAEMDYETQNIDYQYAEGCGGYVEVYFYASAEEFGSGEYCILGDHAAQRHFGNPTNCTMQGSDFSDATSDCVNVNLAPTVTKLEASIPSTPNAVSPNPAPSPGIHSTTNNSIMFADANTPDLMVLFKGSSTQATVTAVYSPTTAGNLLRWKLDRDPTDTVESGLPTLSATSGPQVNITPIKAGNFRLICYYDANNNSSYDSGEELKVLRFAIVRFQVNANESTIDSQVQYINNGQPETAIANNAMLLQFTVTLDGGGSNKTIGVSKVHLGDIGNLINDSSVIQIQYPVPIPTPTPPGNVAGTATQDPDGNVCNPQPCLPMVDTGRVESGQQPTGGDSAFRVFSYETGNGRERVLTSADNIPGIDNWAHTHPTTRNLWSATQGAYNFREYIVAYSDNFPRYYVVLGRADWTVSYIGILKEGLWSNTKSKVTLQGMDVTSAAFTINVGNDGSPMPASSAGVQVLGRSLVNEHVWRYSPSSP
jgi:hypothetical protein